MDHGILAESLKSRAQRTIPSALLACIIAIMLYSGASANQSTLTLSGVFHRSDGRSSALFTLPNSKQKLVANGRIIMANTQLIAIEPRRVKVRTNGNERWIKMDGVHKTDMAPNAQAQAPTQQIYENVTSTRDSQYRRRVIRLKSSLTQDIRDGRSRGFLIKEGDIFDVLHGANLQPGDIIQSINGNAFSRREDIDEFAYNWQPSGRYSYRVLRGGKSIEP